MVLEVSCKVSGLLDPRWRVPLLGWYEPIIIQLYNICICCVVNAVVVVLIDAVASLGSCAMIVVIRAESEIVAQCSVLYIRNLHAQFLDNVSLFLLQR